MPHFGFRRNLGSRVGQVMVLAAVVVLVGAGASTAQKLITGSDIRNGSITGSDLKDETVASKDVKDNAINHDKLSNGCGRSSSARTAPALREPPGLRGPLARPAQLAQLALYGARGPQGVVNATFDSDTGSTATEVRASDGDFTGGSLIRDLTLPAGSYEIQATMSVRGGAGGLDTGLNTRVRCNLVNASSSPPENLDTFYQDFFVPMNLPPGYRESLEVGALVTFNTTTKIEVRCFSLRPGGGTGAGSIPNSKIVATEVATITAGH